MFFKVMNGLSGRTPYTQSTSVDVTGHVTLATIYNGIIWYVTEVKTTDDKPLVRFLTEDSIFIGV